MMTLAIVGVVLGYLGVGYGVLAIGTMAGLAGLNSQRDLDEPHPAFVVVAWPLCVVMLVAVTVIGALSKTSEIVQSQAIGVRERYISRQHQLKAKNDEHRKAEGEVDAYLGYRA